jgi:hypothetical protein
MHSNADTFATNLYQNYSAGDLDPSEWLDPLTLASEFATDYESTGYHSYAAAEAALMGVPGDSDHNMRVTLSSAGITVTGSIWTDWEPEGEGNSWVVGKTYDPSNTSKDVFLSYEYTGDSYIEGADQFTRDSSGNYVADGNVTADNYDTYDDVVQVGFQSIEEPFTIEEATNTKTGEKVSEFALESKNAQTADVTLTQEQFNELLAYRTELRESEPSLGSGGGFDFTQFGFGGIPGEGVVLGIAGVIALLLGGRKNS